ncbi:hypothetical protein GCM10025771_10090 [Niveibacterium umoris]|uniref:AlgX/AlgJ SGNH hydrolase-like domain-containing protein n=1 Tax=Niveibacterium umoris TaxID=1193620 RepID=A0A840BIR8_9RHOO|nr:hypothetical protein [Niveibacterium umoris]MBB4013441.1 hypothetical protein [Niveibacterium umoris]
MRPLAWCLAGIALTALMLELLLRLLPVSTATLTGYYIDPLILTYPPHHRFTLSEGWALERALSHRANNYGFLASEDFVPDAAGVAVIGDSYVEANMLPEPERVTARLAARTPGTRWWALGGPGSNLLDYAQRAAWASRTLQARRFVFVIESGDVVQVRCGSGNIHGLCIDRASGAVVKEPQPGAGTLKCIARESALAQYLFSQVKLTTEGVARIFKGADKPRPQAHTAESEALKAIDRAAVAAFLERFKALAPAQAVFVIADPVDPDVHGYGLSLLEQALEQAGYAVIKTGPLFREHAAHSRLSLRVSPQDGHWNPLASDLVAAAVAARMR